MLQGDDQYATTFVGAYLIPVLVGLSIAGIIAIVTVGFKLAKRLDTQDAQLAAISAEVFPNGGSSIKDAVARIEVTVGGVQAEQKRVAKKLNKHLADAAAV